MDNNKKIGAFTDNERSRLERITRLLNRINLPSGLFASLDYQQCPIPVSIDGVLSLYAGLFELLGKHRNHHNRALLFERLISAHFRLEQLEDLGYERHCRKARHKLDYRRLLRGWLFSSESRDAAVLKGWAESRFGLRTLYHHEALIGNHANNNALNRYYYECSTGCYGSNAIWSQLDLLYSYVQYEVVHRWSGPIIAYRGINGDLEALLDNKPAGENIILLNNLNSFTLDKDRADEFGDQIIRCEIPLSKIAMFAGALPGLWQGESEILVLGGYYRYQHCN